MSPNELSRMRGIVPRDLTDLDRRAAADEIRSAAEWFVPTSPAEIALTVAFGPGGKLAKVGGLSAMSAFYSPDTEAGLTGKAAKWFDEVARTARPENEGRLKQILADMPYTSNIYAPRAVARALDGGEQLRGVTPDEFLELAYPLEMRPDARDLVEHYRRLVADGEWSTPPQGIFQQSYIDHQRVTPFEGYSDVPFLQMKELPMSTWKTTGHEGRHRNLALRKLYGDNPQLTRFLREYDSENPLTTKFPSFVHPEVDEGYTLDLSNTRRYKKGGLTQCLCGGHK